MIGQAAAALDRFRGWTLNYVRDEIPLATLRLLLRQPLPGRDKGDMLGTADMEMIDWMDANGIEPGQEFDR